MSKEQEAKGTNVSQRTLWNWANAWVAKPHEDAGAKKPGGQRSRTAPATPVSEPVLALSDTHGIADGAALAACESEPVLAQSDKHGAADGAAPAALESEPVLALSDKHGAADEV